MLKLIQFKQSPSCCGPASLKIVLNYYGIYLSEKKLAKLSGCTLAKGTRAESLLKVAKSLGFNGLIKDFAEIKDIKNYVINKKIPVIVAWFSVDDGHYSVVADIDKEHIYLQDPEFGKLVKMKINKFKRVWFDFDGNYLKAKKNVIIRRMIAIYEK